MVWLPIGVARCSVGSGGLEETAAGAPPWLPTGLAFGDGGMASPRRGGPRPLLAPGMAGRRRGTGAGPALEVGREMGVGAGATAGWAVGSMPCGAEGCSDIFVVLS